jgi:vacuolar-type H+-ATPase subunit H
MNDAFYDEKLADIKDAIDVIFRFQLYRRGKIDKDEDTEKTIGSSIDQLLGCALEYSEIMEENETLKKMYHEAKEKIKELEQNYETLWNESNEQINKLKKEGVKNAPSISNRARKNGENDAQCLECKEYNKQEGLCKWGYCDWYTRKPMAFDGRLCCKTCAFDINGECTYLKEQDKREKQRNNK